ncbi:MAG: hypothetical protein A3E82_04545 [Gammaproteobacteria bacterium RIFCSPHIGHO2_12_FULL_38_11]|nr:MAG: hypothetical protein A3E82_04545 [Gammaproteobacteria bacterium RIFCSPHIGHO2_12_FULL_38_11]
MSTTTFNDLVDSINAHLPASSEASAYEQLAVFTANQIKIIMQIMRQTPIDIKQLQEKIKKISQIDAELTKHILQNTSAFQNDEIINPYFQYYLTQVSRLNGFLNRVVGITAESTDLAALQTIPIISNPFLLQKTKVTMEINVGSIPNTFRAAYVFKKEETGKNATQYFYHPKATPNGKPHQDEKAFQDANKKIGAATQLSNATNVFKFLAQRLPGVHSGQERDDYFKPADVKAHELEQKLFRSARKKIANGLQLTEDEKTVVFQGKYYRIQSPVKFMRQQIEGTVVSHVSHASEVITLSGSVPLCINTDPVHKHTFTGNSSIKEKIISTAGSIAYNRQTDPAFGTDEYPAINVVLITHNHHDHMCCESLTEAYAENPGTLFIVPVGDKKHAEAFHLKNVIEFASWDDYADIKLTDENGNKATYRISAFPAKHASARTLADDTCHSLYMGYMMQNLAQKELILCTGDTAVLDDIHFDNLEKYLLDNDLTISTAVIAHGPDRPRSQMVITHQSTADAVAMHARFNAMNLKVMQARQKTRDDALMLLNSVASRGVGYHQGCYRLGLLSLSDVPSTLLRMMSVLENLKNESLIKLVDDQGEATTLLTENLHYIFLDDFEKQGLIDTIKAYIKTGIREMNAGDVKALIESYLTIPSPGFRTDLSLQKPNAGFPFNYEQLIVNRDSHDNSNHPKQAYEYFARHISQEVYQNFIHQNATPADIILFFKTAFESYVARKIVPGVVNSKVKAANDFCRGLNSISQEISAENHDSAWTIRRIKSDLTLLAKTYFTPKDESIRDESHLHTLITMLSGLINDVPGFRQQFSTRQSSLQLTQLATAVCN